MHFNMRLTSLPVSMRIIGDRIWRSRNRTALGGTLSLAVQQMVFFVASGCLYHSLSTAFLRFDLHSCYAPELTDVFLVPCDRSRAM